MNEQTTHVEVSRQSKNEFSYPILSPLPVELSDKIILISLEEIKKRASESEFISDIQLKRKKDGLIVEVSENNPSNILTPSFKNEIGVEYFLHFVLDEKAYFEQSAVPLMPPVIKSENSDAKTLQEVNFLIETTVFFIIELLHGYKKENWTKDEISIKHELQNRLQPSEKITDFP